MRTFKTLVAGIILGSGMTFLVCFSKIESLNRAHDSEIEFYREITDALSSLGKTNPPFNHNKEEAIKFAIPTFVQTSNKTNFATLTLVWDAVSNAVSYQVYCIKPDGTHEYIKNVTSTTAEVTVPRGETVKFFVTAVNAAGFESPPSGRVGYAVPVSAR